MEVILTDTEDNAIGVMEKLQAHREGKLHRAFSIFIFNRNGEMLLHQRADGKYHSGGLWTNACCSHPLPGEATEEAAHRRLREELGFDTKLDYAFRFTYQAHVGNDLTEHEIDHVFTGIHDGPFEPDAAEVQALRFMPMKELRLDLAFNGHAYTQWFKIAFPLIEEQMGSQRS